MLSRAIEHAYNVVISMQDTQEDPNVAADFRKPHETCMFYHLALQEFQALGLHKTFVIDDEISADSLDAYCAFRHFSRYAPKTRTSVCCLAGDGYRSLKPRCVHAPSEACRSSPEARKNTPSKYSNRWFMCCDTDSGRILSMAVMHEPECTEYVVEALASVLWMYPDCWHFVYDRACALVNMARKQEALNQIEEEEYTIDWFHAHRHATSCFAICEIRLRDVLDEFFPGDHNSLNFVVCSSSQDVG